MKIQISSQAGKRKYLHKLTHDNSTTESFGFCQPILCRELNAQDTASVRFAQVVRLNPLVKPTFGSMSLRTYTSFIKTADIYHAFESLLTGQAYNGAGTRYIPTEVPNLTNATMTWIIRAFSSVSFYTATNVTDTTDGVDLTTVNLVTNSSQINTIYSEFLGNIDDNYEQASKVILALGVGLQPYSDGSLDSYTGFNYRVNPVEIDAGDWIYVFNYESGGTTIHVMVVGTLNNYGRKLRKIWLGLGNQLNLNDTPVNMVRLFAYYKAWFDLFAPQRDITWKDTHAFKIMESLEQSGTDFSAWLTNPANAVVMASFICDLANCYYTINPDYASAHIVGTSTQVASQSNPQFSYLGVDGSPVFINTDDDGQPSLDDTTDNLSVNPSGLKILERLTKYVNIHTAVGGKIREFMRSIFNSEYVDEVDSQFIGSQIVNIEADDVFSTNQSSQVDLGEFAGKALAGTDGTKDKLTFTAKAHGYLISFIAIVPDAKLCQAFDPTSFNIRRFDFHTPMFDGMTLVPSRKATVYGVEEIHIDGRNSIGNFDNGFGNIPIYTGNKIAHNIVNGDMSLAATRASYLPFNIDKLLPFRKVALTLHSGSATQYDSVKLKVGVRPETLVAGTFWRYIGRNRWYGNYDRIFVDEGDNSWEATSTQTMQDILGQFDDHFVIHNLIDLNVTGYELPMSQSFDTGAFDGDTMSVEKS